LASPGHSVAPEFGILLRVDGAQRVNFEMNL
jgi:hypothetical protein